MNTIQSKREANKIEKKKRLLDAAYKLFMEKGIQDTTVNNIVKEAGVAKGTYYLYFKDKAEIEEQLIIDEAVKVLNAAIRYVGDHAYNRFEDQFIAAVDFIIEYLSKNTSIMHFIKKDLSYAVYSLNTTSKNTSIKNVLLQLYAQYRTNVDAVTISNPDIVVSLCIEFLGASIYSSLVYNMPRPIEELKPYIHNIIRMIFHEYSESNTAKNTQ